MPKHPKKLKPVYAGVADIDCGWVDEHTFTVSAHFEETLPDDSMILPLMIAALQARAEALAKERGEEPWKTEVHVQDSNNERSH